MSIPVPDRLVNVLAEALAFWHDDSGLDRCFRDVTSVSRSHGSNRAKEYLKALESLDQLGQSLMEFMDTKRYSGLNRDYEAEWMAWKNQVRNALASQGYRYKAGGRVIKIAPQITFATPDLTRIRNTRLKSVIEHDCDEIRRAFSVQCWKAAIILLGAAIEATIADALVITLKDASVMEKDLHWLITKAVKENLVSPDVAQNADHIREYRNLIHANRQINDGLECNQHTATIASQVFEMVCEKLPKPS